MQMSNILGINWEQNSTAALMVNEKIVSASSEERFSGIKNDERYPKAAIEWCLDSNAIKSSDLDLVCVISKSWSPAYSLLRHYTNWTIWDYIREQDNIWLPRIYDGKTVSAMNVFREKLDTKQYPGEHFWNPIIEKLSNVDDHASNSINIEYGQSIRAEVISQHLGIKKDKIRFVNHHLGHAAYAYFASDTKSGKFLVITLDAWGDDENYSAWEFRKSDNQPIEVKKIVSGNNFIIGRLYRYVTLILNMKPNEHEYKVMGLAPYAKNAYSEQVFAIFKKYQDVVDLKFVDLDRPQDLYFAVKKDLEGFRFDSIAGGLQLFTDHLIEKWVQNLINAIKPDALALGGGVALNVKTNGLITSLMNGKPVRIPPTPDDSSQAMGSIYAEIMLGDNLKIQSSKNLNGKVNPITPYLGPEFSNEIDICVSNLKSNTSLKIQKYNAFTVASFIASGKVIARFNGRAEFGARALGNRSILADPSNINVKKKINESIKSRDFWMPFAATVLADYASEYLILESDIEAYEYMTNSCKTTLVGQEKLVAAIHPYDFSCRPQILLTNKNPGYAELISEFGKLTSVYALLNTSFNFHGKPIVSQPIEAVETFLNSNLDGMILGDYFLIKID